MNRTLEELARANLNGQGIPEYLWEYAISHAAYVRNRAYMKPMGTLTPYQGWFKNKPNITHCDNLEHPSGSFYKAKRKNARCYPNQKGASIKQAFLLWDTERWRGGLRNVYPGIRK